MFVELINKYILSFEKFFIEHFLCSMENSLFYGQHSE